MRLLPLFLLAGGLFAGEELPDWARQAVDQPAPKHSNTIKTVVLLREESVAVDAGGTLSMRERGVIRIAQPGAGSLSASRSYNAKTGRIRDFRGWLLSPDGTVTRLGRDLILDIALSMNETYNESRAKVLELGARKPPGSVFAYEVTEEEKTIFTQYYHRFQESAPVVVSRFVLSLPPGWEARASLFNHEPVEPQVAGNTYTWELRNLPPITTERYGPNLNSLAPRLGVSWFPAGENKAGLKALKDWTDVSSWLSAFVDPPADPGDAVRAKAAELTAGAQTELEKIRAIAAFVQRANYVSIQMNLTYGGGYAPHRAEDVLAKNYGDCKDKATLMRALLKSAGIPSYLVVIHASDRHFVRPEWPSPLQFNHAIVAVCVSPETVAPTVADFPGLGRLLIFDPTDPVTPVGDLPRHEQAANALVIAGPSGGLLKMPQTPARSNRIESTIEATLDASGRLDARVTRTYFGEAASSLQGIITERGIDELRRSFERSLGSRLGGVTVKQAETSGRIEEGHLQLTLEFGVDHFAQLVQGLAIVKPGGLALGHDYTFPAGERKMPLSLSGEIYKDTVRLKVPPGYTVDELPDALKLDSRYAVYQASWKADGGDVLFEQSLEVRGLTIPAREYATLRSYFEGLGGKQAAPVVLAKKK
jgi:transglutaminase-like putative cysteine protease